MVLELERPYFSKDARLGAYGAATPNLKEHILK